MYKALNYWIYGGYTGVKTPYEFIDFAVSQQIDQLSLQLHVKENTPPAVMWHTADDGIKVQNSLAFADAIWQKGGIAELHIFAHGPHGLGLAEHYENIKVWPQLVAQFLKTVCGFTAE